jgi:hypothetical protein
MSEIALITTIESKAGSCLTQARFAKAILKSRVAIYGSQGALIDRDSRQSAPKLPASGCQTNIEVK